MTLFPRLLVMCGGIGGRSCPCSSKDISHDTTFRKRQILSQFSCTGFSMPSEEACARVVYFHGEDSDGKLYLSLLNQKFHSFSCLTISRWELCGAQLFAQLLYHVKEVYRIPLSDCRAWTDSTIVLNWLVRSSCRFKTYVGNCVSHIVELIPPDRWSHASGVQNLADCATWGVFLLELVSHDLWWSGPEWLHLDFSGWPEQCFPSNSAATEANEGYLHVELLDPLLFLVHYCSSQSLEESHCLV